MARSPLTLAALATSAVPELDVVATRTHSRQVAGDFDAAVLSLRDGIELIVRVPRNQAAETEQSADLLALRALSTGVRSRLPFHIADFVGQAPVGPTRAIVYGYLDGLPADTSMLEYNPDLAHSIGRSIAAVHSLPTAFIGDAGLPQQTAEDSRAATAALIARAAETGKLPAALLQRWEQATDDAALWQFAPSVINGKLTADSFLVDGYAVSAVLGWSELCVGDAARDLHWVLAAPGDAGETTLAAYTAARSGGIDRLLTQRALLYAELELARWLLHGVATRSEAIVEDAVQMLDALVESVHSQRMNPLTQAVGPVLAVDDVEELLAQTPRSSATPQEGHGALHTDSYDVSAFESESELGTAFDSGFDSADEAEQATGEPGTGTGSVAVSDDLDTGPIELPGR
ncbi:Predicted kinase, aminoglycoside phosphotransferase (APT) family [Microterricola viridarii]|uniref:Predicted kinase, aminoglycoside phosphotransferase (APT) family n=1 Tax=Microterricola viridarii TaxID=412690 RepID=A0A1H1RVD0_9MICO|nr:Predicted kinase, aminoglycoside phosphotransferase (APT) family [Microterricola viridarii]